MRSYVAFNIDYSLAPKVFLKSKILMLFPPDQSQLLQGPLLIIVFWLSTASSWTKQLLGTPEDQVPDSAVGLWLGALNHKPAWTLAGHLCSI
jgi:hypothetical protein